MSLIEYQHNIPASFQAKLIQLAMGLFAMKKATEKKMISNGFKKEPAKVPKSLLANFVVHEMLQRSRKVWTISPKAKVSNTVILFLHGGAYMANITKLHWDLIEILLINTKATIVIPDYPLAPDATHMETYEFIEDLYANILVGYSHSRIVFMGDSAGGGLALGFAQKLRNESKKQPHELILFSPWLDISMCNPELQILEKDDKILSIAGLKSAGQKYAGTIDLKDYRVSPLYGDFTGLCKISIFTGTRDVLFADAQTLKHLVKDLNMKFSYFEYPGMFHDWVIIAGLKETHDVIEKVKALFNE